MYDARRYPEGVPNPYVPTVEPFPNYVHGPDYTRPTFAMTYMRAPFNVVGPAPFDFPALEGLGDTEKAIQVGAGVAAIAAGAGAAALAVGLLAASTWRPGDITTDRASAFIVGAMGGGLIGFIAAITAVAVGGAGVAIAQEGT